MLDLLLHRVILISFSVVGFLGVAIELLHKELNACIPTNMYKLSSNFNHNDHGTISCRNILVTIKLCRHIMVGHNGSIMVKLDI